MRSTLDHAQKVPTPYGCRWCGIAQRAHARQWAPIIGMHQWQEPSQEQIKERMTRRRADRLAAKPAVYHATTAWAADHTGESADPYCADCRTDGCRPWMRIQSRLDRQRWALAQGLPGSSSGASGDWGGDEPWPF